LTTNWECGKFLTHLFQREGHTVRVAENGRQAMMLLHEGQPTFFFQMSGCQTWRALIYCERHESFGLKSK